MNIDVVRQELATGLGIPISLLIWANQNGTRPKDTHATLYQISVDEDTRPEDIITAKGQEDEIHINYVNSFDVQVYDKEHNNAIKRLRNMINHLNTPPVLANMATSGFVLIDSGSMIDLTAILDGSSFESRASVSLRFRVKDVTPYKQEFVETATIKNM